MAFIPSAPSLFKSSLSHICGSSDNTSYHSSRLNSTQQQVQHENNYHKRSFIVTASAASNSRKFLVGGNWKCNLNKSSINDLIDVFNSAPKLDESSIQVVVAPPSIYIESTRSKLRQDFEVSAQNNWISEGGAFTGEIDAKMIKDVGADWVILGHSERRHLPQIKEPDLDIATKTKYAIEQANLSVIYCIGELLEERESNNTFNVCETQLSALNQVISQDQWNSIVIAYEPVWAIGTGKVATPEQAEQVHDFIRSWLNKNVSATVAQSTRILYGGSVSPGNCQELAKQPNIDGFLVGGASLKPTFLEIIDSYKVAVAETV